MDWNAWHDRRKKAPAVARVPLCADGEAVAELEAAERDPTRKTEIPALREAVEQATMVVVVQALNGDDYRDLKDAHRPKDPEKARRDEWDDSFLLALVQASVVEPEDLDVAAMWETLTLAERAALFLAARDLNEAVPDLGFIKLGTGTTSDTERPSNTSDPEG